MRQTMLDTGELRCDLSLGHALCSLSLSFVWVGFPPTQNTQRACPRLMWSQKWWCSHLRLMLLFGYGLTDTLWLSVAQRFGYVYIPLPNRITTLTVIGYFCWFLWQCFFIIRLIYWKRKEQRYCNPNTQFTVKLEFEALPRCKCGGLLCIFDFMEQNVGL